ncbi:flagellar hook-length control protein FliK [Oceanicella actignis]|uniref:flagellar hook-length control protein FliK n=1 Tax=Oceanicella actignis TaxID=1189325 RepID=UPI00125B85E1|nr:flagellar hook-length control protein FliK [Oceanicella actignis]TYO89231.1 flagellar hook-length control protein FliK [Oceanicella actignis]
MIVAPATQTESLSPAAAPSPRRGESPAPEADFAAAFRAGLGERSIATATVKAPPMAAGASMPPDGGEEGDEAEPEGAPRPDFAMFLPADALGRVAELPQSSAPVRDDAASASRDSRERTAERDAAPPAPAHAPEVVTSGPRTSIVESPQSAPHRPGLDQNGAETAALAAADLAFPRVANPGEAVDAASERPGSVDEIGAEAPEKGEAKKLVSNGAGQGGEAATPPLANAFPTSTDAAQTLGAPPGGPAEPAAPPEVISVEQTDQAAPPARPTVGQGAEPPLALGSAEALRQGDEIADRDAAEAESKAEADGPDLIQSAARAERVERFHAAAPPAHGPDRASAGHVIRQLTEAVSRSDDGAVEVRLDPPELGRVRITMSAVDGTMNAHVSADRPEALDLMRRHAEQLSAELARLGHARVDLSFSSGGGQPGRPRGHDAFFSEAASEPAELPALRRVFVTGLDMRV